MLVLSDCHTDRLAAFAFQQQSGLILADTNGLRGPRGSLSGPLQRGLLTAGLEDGAEQLVLLFLVTGHFP